MQGRNMKVKFVFDTGTNSLGWCVVELDEDDNPFRIEKAGSRIFSEGREAKTKNTLKATRREGRSARRKGDRFKQRKNFLLSELTKAGLFPEDLEERKALQKLDPLELRANALTKKMEPHEIGRALFHLNQSRGFKSNRKDRSEEVTGGKVSNSVLSLLREMKLMKEGISDEEYKALSKEEKKKAREDEFHSKENAMKELANASSFSFGSFLWKTADKDRGAGGKRMPGLPTRARPNVDSKLYDFYPTRELLEDEFQKIWKAQEKHHPELLTDKVKDRIHYVIFTQRPLKPQTLGRCSYLPELDRAYKAMPTFQRYRIYQDVNSLEWTTSQGEYKLIDYPESRDAIVELLEKPTTKAGNVTFGNMKKVLRKMGLVVDEFNFETQTHKGFDGNLTSNLMSAEERVGDEWCQWNPEKQDEFIELLLGEQTDEEVLENLKSKYSLSAESATACMEAPLIDGTASLSQEAARLLIEIMRDDYCIQSDAVQKVADTVEKFVNPFTRAREGELLEKLPYYGEAFQDGRHIIPGDRNPEDKESGDDYKYYGGVTNPTVHIALNQMRNVVNELIKIYGKPHSISIELARDLPLGKEGRSKLEKQQMKNQEKNKELDKELERLGQTQNYSNRLKLRLWEELDEENEDGRCCPFSGDKIEKKFLFTEQFQIEHLLPFSKSIDDHPTNKVISSRKANAYKGNRTPYEAFSNSHDGYEWGEILKRAQKLPIAKRWRFHEGALEKWQKDNDFTSRHLNDTRYIGRVAKEYLENICPHSKINVIPGKLTNSLNYHWGTHDILDELNGKEAKLGKKDRSDHRHHAVDAITIAATSRSLIQKISTKAKNAKESGLDKVFSETQAPWKGFRKDAMDSVSKIIVSHKIKKKTIDHKTTDGKLHDETARGIISGPDKKGIYTVVNKFPIGKLLTKKKLETIRDPHYRSLLVDAFENGGEKEVLSLANEMGIKSLRCVNTMKIIPIKDKCGKIYKGYKGNGNWGMEIYEYPKGHKLEGEWKWEVISRFEAHQKGFQLGTTKRPDPASRIVMRLRINDCLEVEDKGLKKIMRVQTISSAALTMAEHNEANVDSRNRDRACSFKYFVKSSGEALRKIKARKVYVSPIGELTYLD